MNQLNTRTSEVLDLLAGRVTEAELAARHGVSIEEVHAWRQLFIDGSEAALATHAAPSGRRVKRGVLAAAAGAVTAGTLLYAGFASSQANCPPPAGWPTGLTHFCADTPAVAQDINGNLQQVVAWLVQKVGTQGSAAVTISGDTTISGSESTASNSALEVTGGLTTMRIDGNEIDSTGKLELQRNNPSNGVAVFGLLSASGGLTVPPTASLPTCGTTAAPAGTLRTTTTGIAICLSNNTWKNL